MQDQSFYSQIESHVTIQQSQQFQENNHMMIKCPRCDSTNTKFCYYNNYNLSQPRHFCKNCRRYWTKGGALRNIPIGGSSRKNNAKRVSTKRPAPVPDTDNDHTKGKIGKTLNFNGHFGDLMEMSGSGNGCLSLLLDEGHFGNFIREPSLDMGDPCFIGTGGQGVDPQSGGDSECWSGVSNVWPHLSIYTPDPTLH